MTTPQRYYPVHEPVTPMNLSVSQKLKNALAPLKGPLWIPLLEQGCENLFARVIHGSGPYEDPVKEVYDIKFFEKGAGLLSDSALIVRLVDRASADALCERLNNQDPSVKELTWLSTKGKEHTGGSYIDAANWKEVDYYELAVNGKGRFVVISSVVSPK